MRTVCLVKPPESANLKPSKVTLLPGEEVGEHVAESREEILIVLKGEACLMLGSERMLLKENDVYFVKDGIVHNARNESGKETEYLFIVAFHRN